LESYGTQVVNPVAGQKKGFACQSCPSTGRNPTPPQLTIHVELAEATHITHESEGKVEDARDLHHVLHRNALFASSKSLATVYRGAYTSLKTPSVDILSSQPTRDRGSQSCRNACPISDASEPNVLFLSSRRTR
jgi:hypothetical protein